MRTLLTKATAENVIVVLIADEDRGRGQLLVFANEAEAARSIEEWLQRATPLTRIRAFSAREMAVHPNGPRPNGHRRSGLPSLWLRSQGKT